MYCVEAKDLKTGEWKIAFDRLDIVGVWRTLNTYYGLSPATFIDGVINDYIRITRKPEGVKP